MLKEILNEYGKAREPIFFAIDFNLEKFYIERLESLENIYFDIDGFTNFKNFKNIESIELQKEVISFDEYRVKFYRVIEEIKRGNSYLLNLTAKSKIEVNKSLFEIFSYSKAKFRLFCKDEFICFSPERFVKIENDTIYTYPMKGTIDSKVENAKERILNDEKELAEHVMVVDLLRNDLGIVGRDINVDRFRYIDKIRAGNKELLQVSSQISAKVPSWQDRLGDTLLAMLPAGSITGTPKKKTIEIIKDIEKFDRGFFTGVFGYFDGNKLDSSVMIRFIEKKGNSLFYKSGGGVTIDSNPYNEYRELIDKIYIPT